MFTMAGWNKRAQSTGIVAFTSSIHGGSGSSFAPAELYRHQCGDLLWIVRRRFWVWGETCKFASLHRGYLSVQYRGGLPYCDLQTREEFAT